MLRLATVKFAHHPSIDLLEDEKIGGETLMILASANFKDRSRIVEAQPHGQIDAAFMNGKCRKDSTYRSTDLDVDIDGHAGA